MQTHGLSRNMFTSFSGRQRQLAGNIARKAEFSEILTISLADPEEQIIVQLRDACTRVGFFYVKVSLTDHRPFALALT